MSKSLNPQQQAAVNHLNGPALVVAGAGTGKTTVIVERVKNLIINHSVDPAKILCLTFTEKAAAEMQERIDASLPYGFTSTTVATFHSWCEQLLRDEGLNIGISPGFRLMSDAETISLLNRHLFDLPLSYYRPLGNPTKFLHALIQHISRLKDEDITPQDYQKYSDSLPDSDDTPRQKELADMYQAYEKIKQTKDLLDFGDLICQSLYLFRNRPNILSQIQKKYEYVLVDEFQDTNYSQTLLVNLLCPKPANLMVVADDDQAIYRWRGAAVSNVLDFQSTYPDAKIYVLTTNYRSHQKILDAAYQLIVNNNPDRLEVKAGIDKHLHSKSPATVCTLSHLHTQTADQEAALVAQKISDLTIKGSLILSDIAILVRANAHAQTFVRNLEYLGIPCRFLGPSKLLEQEEIKDLLAFFNLLLNTGDDSAVLRFITQPVFDLSTRDIASLGSYALKHKVSLFSAIQSSLSPDSQISLSESTRSQLAQIDTWIHDSISISRTARAGEILYSFLSKSQILKRVVEYSPPFDQLSSANTIKFFNKINAYETAHPQALLADVVNWLNISLEIGESPLAGEADLSAENSVNIMTIHSAKGLEFNTVFIVNLVNQRFPSIGRKELIPVPDALVKEKVPQGDFHLQEERRLMYVGITRAKENLFLTSADFYGDGKRQKKISPFVYEALGNIATPTQNINFLPPNRQTQSKKPDHEPVKITHISYSQIQTFLDCPLHYKLKYILNLPTQPSAASSFGNSIHNALKEIYKHTSANINVVDILNSVWTSLGYTNKMQEQDYHQLGITYLQQFLSTGLDPEQPPLHIEKEFKLILPPPNPEITPITIEGKIDRVDLLPDGFVKIIDYKTSTTPMTQKEADESLQLSFYALAVSRLKSSVFPIPAEKIILQLHYFKTGENITTHRTELQLNDAISQIYEYVSQIEKSDFACNGSIICQKCDFPLLCTAR